ncbi:hypothetical protein [Streptomyces sp. NPDC058457]|uniref:hypothetical protein n=1 Tax=Streptomyces sp. NPDC058457 TaxID=3346507 RepID=UPI00365B459B
MRDYRVQPDGEGVEVEPGAPVTAQTVEAGSCGETVRAALVGAGGIGLHAGVRRGACQGRVRNRGRPGPARPGFASEPVVSELLTNAIRYGEPPIQLDLVLDRNLICEVSDASDTSPQQRRARVCHEGGRSLTSVAQLRESWATGTPGTARTSWAEISRAMR